MPTALAQQSRDESAIPAQPRQQALDQFTSVNLVEENDSFWSASDKHYTQGARLSFASGETTEGARVRLAERLLLTPKRAEYPSTYRRSFYFGQSLYTPENLALVHPDPADRPYAGWLYFGMALYRENSATLDRAEITLGMVGPVAGGESVQNDWHYFSRSYLGGGRKANGWSEQLGNEPGLILTQERKWRLPARTGSLEMDLLPEVNASVGNVLTYGGVGFLARLGQRIAVDWGPPRAQPGLSGTDYFNRSRFDGRGFAWYAFAGTEARLVARNIFLDGNSFGHSAHVSKEPLVADFTAGITAVIPVGRVTLSYVRRTAEFTTQNGQDQFLSLSASLVF
jgi:lipid A 3-O-deacylase